MSTSRSAADAHSLNQLRGLRKAGKLASPLDDNTAKELLKTPPTNAALMPSAGLGDATESPTNTRALSAMSGFRLDSSDTLSIGARPLSGQIAAFKASRKTPSVTPLALQGATAAQVLELLTEETAQFQSQCTAHAKMSREHMQRSLIQLFEDTVRDKFVASSNPGGNLDASLRAQSINNSFNTPQSIRSTAVKSFATMAGKAGSLRPIDQSGMLGVPRATSRGVDALTDFVMPDGIRLQLTTDINAVLDHELNRLGVLLIADVQRVTNHVKSLSTRVTAVEEELLHAAAALEAAGEALHNTTLRTSQLEKELREREAECEAKDKQMDVLREQITRRNATLDETRFKFRKEVMRYKAKIYEMELEAEGALGKRRDLQRKIIQFDTGADEAEFAEETSAAVETAVAAVTEKFEEQIRKLNLEHAKAVKASQVETAAKIAERDHEIQTLRSKLRQATTGGAERKPDHHVASLTVTVPAKTNSAAVTPTTPSLEVRH